MKEKKFYLIECQMNDDGADTMNNMKKGKITD